MITELNSIVQTIIPPRTLLEEWIPNRELSRDAAIEMSFKPIQAYMARCKELKIIHKGRYFYDPKIRSLHPWLARRPRCIARALNLAALLPPNVDAGDFLRFLGFNRKNLVEATSKGYPPLLSYLPPDLSSIKIPREATILDPMAGGGSIPLESAMLGINTIACEYNPVAYLLLRATIEFPAKYGIELWKRLTKEVKNLSSYVSKELSPYYEAGVEGYIILRQVELNNKVIPLQTVLPLSRDLYIKVEENGSASLTRSKAKLSTKTELLHRWMNQHVNVMLKKSELYGVVHRCIAVQTSKHFRLANESDHELLQKAYTDYLSLDSICLPKVSIPKDNEVFFEILPLKHYHMLFNPRQSLALHSLISYVRNRIQELIEKEGEFGAALGLYLAFGVDRIADFNSIITSWNRNTLTIRDGIGSYYKYRKFRLEGNYAEAIVPYRTLDWVYEPDATDTTAGGICPVVKELAEKLEGKDVKIDVYMCDVMRLSHHFKCTADVINVDPPYYDQHIYSDFSEFFWPLLKTTIEPAIPLLFDKNLLNWSPTSWTVPKSDEVIAREGNKSLFEVKLRIALKEMRNALKDNGVLILWFSHRSMDAWKAVVDALNEAQFRITGLIPFPSEHPTRSITRGGHAGINRVLIIVARKREHVKERNSVEILNKLKGYIRESKLYPGEIIPEREIELLTMAASYALSKC